MKEHYMEVYMEEVTERQQLRILVAKDVLESLKELTVKNGEGYLQVEIDDFGDILNDSGEDSKVIAGKLKNKCTVCALGACFLSLVYLDNDFDFLDGMHSYLDEIGEIKLTHIRLQKLNQRLLKVFSGRQLSLIETAFECQMHNPTEDFVSNTFKGDKTLLERAIKFGWSWHSSNERLKAIMENIIENEGEFIPA